MSRWIANSSSSRCTRRVRLSIVVCRSSIRLLATRLTRASSPALVKRSRRGLSRCRREREMEMRFDGKVALITGGGSGIGEATAKRFAAEGAKVVVADINTEGARRVVGEIQAAAGQAAALHADVADPGDAQAMIRFAVDTFGRLDILHNNAVSGAAGAVADMSVEDWNRAIAVNLTGPFLGT